MKEKFWAVVPAAGVGRRMRCACPKQYLTLRGQPVLLHTLERLGSCEGIAGVCVGISSTDQYWAEMTAPMPWLKSVSDGGRERADTVLQILHDMAGFVHAQDWVLVHDAVRPCVTHADIKLLMEQASRLDGGLLARPLTDTVKLADSVNKVEKTVPREGLWRALTPQMFRYADLCEALEGALDSGFQVTDEASAMEHAGYHPLLLEGRIDNIKITLPGDLELAELFLSHQGAA